MLNEALTSIKGIGPTRAERFAALGLFTFSDLICFMPREYRDYSRVTNICDLKQDDYAVIRVTELGSPKTVRIPRSHLTVTMVSVSDGTGRLQATWYNQAYAAKNIPTANGGYVIGKFDKRRGMKLLQPAFTSVIPGIQPIYPLVKGLNQSIIRNAVRIALNSCRDEITDELGESIRKEFSLMPKADALENAHFPQDAASLNAARRSIAFEDALLFTIMLAYIRSLRSREKGISFDVTGIKDEFLKLIPFALTNAQSRIIDEIACDMHSSSPMNRLIQGDVGSGKTVLALYAMYAAMKNGYQSALMAPTEILAQQHYKQLKSIFGEKAAIITGRQTKKQREELIGKIAEGKVTAVTGTHALIEGDVKFRNLGIVITDEQHRFGVQQRAKLGSKAATPDVMIMSATPIPRTLSLILYGDLDVSILNDMPPGRIPVNTKYVPQSKRIAMYRYIEKTVQEEGIQAYVVCPMIEDNEEMESVNSAEAVFDELSEMLSVRVALMHGRMKNAEKESTMEAFRRGEIDVLVSTTVIEVGVDVPNANIIAIESADRFGLAQLHQLRGRVGRGNMESYCFLLSDSDSKLVRDRLKTLTETNDGFKIAEKDLEIRGPGDFIGTRQHGEVSLGAALGADLNTLIEAHEAAERIIKEDTPDCRRLIDKAKQKYERSYKDIAIN